MSVPQAVIEAVAEAIHEALGRDDFGAANDDERQEMLDIARSLWDKGLLANGEIRKAKAQAWEEGYGDCYNFHMSHGLQGTETNPYTEEP